MTTTDTPRAGRREWIGLAVLALACLLYVMDLTVLHLAVPAISEDLQPSSAQLLWIIDIYGFMVAGFLITMGTLGDRIGRRKLLLIGAAAFGVAVAPRRVLDQPRDAHRQPGAARDRRGDARAVDPVADLQHVPGPAAAGAWRSAVWISAFSAGSAIGPVLGGLLLEHFWWGSVFLLALPVMALLLVLGPDRAARVPRPERGPARPRQRGHVARRGARR